MKLRCPHCKAWAHVRSSVQITPLLREKYLVCTNAACGHAFAAATEINRTLSPSAIPDPSIQLPFSAHIQRRLMAEQLMRQPVAARAFMPPGDGIHAASPSPQAPDAGHVDDGAPQLSDRALASG